MKASLVPVICLLAFGVQKLNAQDYIPMDTITDWKIQSAFFQNTWYYWYTYEGDTVIDNKTYRIILNHELEDSDVYIYHYFREDRDSRKVYKYFPADNAEILYYDFSLDIGDDFYVAESDALFTVYSIDTVLSEVGPLRRWYLERNGLYFTYTEAIGGQVPDYQYWIYVQDPTHDVVCAYHYCDIIFSSGGNCDPYPARLDTTQLISSFCEGDLYLLPDGNTTPFSGSYGPYTFSSTNGCDSIVFVELSSLSPDYMVIDTTICEGDTFEGGGPYTFTNQHGCDSIVSIDVTVVPLHHLDQSYELCPGQEVYGISEPGVYTLILSSEIACDTVLTLFISLLPEGDPACITATMDHSFDNVNIYPNPVCDQLYIETGDQSFELDIIDFTGSTMDAGLLLYAGSNTINTAHLAGGLYLLKMKSDSGTRYFKLIRQ